ncbi:DUF952 domain-containing protein [Catenovulum sediminis]|uniref:DUF952 domain-containing protein n=1 Tax=Catenovulum sediminis TaxID=1740262 RepID=A0ABV1RJN9_9ALTE|nr:DUF952 domain-containing protein [Catenovulum sediminis]
MGVKLEVNSVLCTEQKYELKVGKLYPFNIPGNRFFSNETPIWLTNLNWLPLAEISIISQTLENNGLTGRFRVDYLYQGDEQQTLANIFSRMYVGLNDPFIYLIASEAEYQASQISGQIIRDSLQAEGFIHASPKSQLNRVANKFYKNTQSPLILVVDKTKITSPVKWEPAKGGLYPHIYGPLNIDAVVKTEAIALNESGEFFIDAHSRIL